MAISDSPAVFTTARGACGSDRDDGGHVVHVAGVRVVVPSADEVSGVADPLLAASRSAAATEEPVWMADWAAEPPAWNGLAVAAWGPRRQNTMRRLDDLRACGDRRPVVLLCDTAVASAELRAAVHAALRLRSRLCVMPLTIADARVFLEDVGLPVRTPSDVARVVTLGVRALFTDRPDAPTAAEAHWLRAFCLGVPRTVYCESRRIGRKTLDAHSSALIRKASCESLSDVALRVLRAGIRAIEMGEAHDLP